MNMTSQEAIDVFYINSMVVYASASALGTRDNNTEQTELSKQVMAEANAEPLGN